MPSGGAGLYFLSTHLVTYYGKEARFNIKQNTERLCGFHEDNRNNDGLNLEGSGGCSMITMLNDGKLKLCDGRPSRAMVLVLKKSHANFSR